MDDTTQAIQLLTDFRNALTRSLVDVVPNPMTRFLVVDHFMDLLQPILAAKDAEVEYLVEHSSEVAAMTVIEMVAPQLEASIRALAAIREICQDHLLKGEPAVLVSDVLSALNQALQKPDV